MEAAGEMVRGHAKPGREPRRRQRGLAQVEMQETFAAVGPTIRRGTDGGLAHFNVSEGNGFFGYTFDGECYVEKGGVQYNIRAQAPIPNVRSAYHHFIDSIRDNTPHIATGEQGLTVMRLLDAIYASAAKGTPVQVR
jgi:predicted dehydrogenase